MDEMKLKLSTKFMRGMISKLLSKMIYTKFGYKIDIQLNDLIVKYNDGRARLYVDADVDIDGEEFMNIMKSVGLD